MEVKELPQPKSGHVGCVGIYLNIWKRRDQTASEHQKKKEKHSLAFSVFSQDGKKNSRLASIGTPPIKQISLTLISSSFSDYISLLSSSLRSKICPH